MESPDEEPKSRSHEPDATPLPASSSSPVPPQSMPPLSSGKKAAPCSPVDTPGTPTEREQPSHMSPRRKKPRVMGPAHPPPSLRETKVEKTSGLSHRDEKGKVCVKMSMRVQVKPIQNPPPNVFLCLDIILQASTINDLWP